MRIVVKPVGKAGEIREIEDTLEVYQEIVGGYIQTFRFTDDILVVLNEEGKMEGLEPNFAIPCKGGMKEVIVGDVAFVSVDGCEFAGLTDEHIDFLSSIGLLERTYVLEYKGFKQGEKEPCIEKTFEVKSNNNTNALLEGDRRLERMLTDYKFINGGMFIDGDTHSTSTRDIDYMDKDGNEINGELVIKEVK